MLNQVKQSNYNGIFGINIGKNKLTPNEEAAGDYLSLFNTFAPLSDYLAVNVSSPNTPNLRQLQDKAALDEILAALQESNPPPVRPILVKVAGGKQLQGKDLQEAHGR